MFLKFYQEIVNELRHGDALCIMASGLGALEIIATFVEMHCDGQSLVLLLNATANDLDFIRMRLMSNLHRKGDGDTAPLSSSGILQSIGGDVLSTERQRMYLNGGCLAMSARVLVADMLNKVIPMSSIDGILVQRAERLSFATASNLNFALEIYRKQNRKGFIRGFSENAQRLCGSSKVTMQRLFVPTVTIWPRFRVSVSECLKGRQSELDIVELSLKMTSSMRVIQESITEILEVLLNELKRSTRGTVSLNLSVENGQFLFDDFERSLRSAFKPHWHSLSERTHHLIRDLISLKRLCSFVLDHDAVTFYRHLMAMKQSAIGRQTTSTFGAPKAVWLLTDSAEKLMVTAKQRVYSFTGTRSKRRKVNGTNTETTDIPNDGSISLKLEVNPKWTVLVNVMAEIANLQTEHSVWSPVVIVTKTKSTAKQLAAMLVSGTGSLMENYWRKYLEHIARTQSDPQRESGRRPLDEERRCLMLSFDAMKQRQNGDRFPFHLVADDEKDDKQQFVSSSSPSNGEWPWSTTKGDGDGNDNDGNGLNSNRRSMTPSASPSSSDRGQFALGSALDVLCGGLWNRSVIPNGRKVVIHALDDAVCFALILWRTLPQFVVLYDVILPMVRELEVFHSFYAQKKTASSSAQRVYLLSYRSSVEEQVYLNQIRREKESFLQLIREKGDLILPVNTDRKMHESVLEPPSSALTSSASLSLNLKHNVNGNATNLMSKRSQKPMGRNMTSRVIVDLREIRDSTALPLMLYREGIEVVTATLTVGDYILSPNLCVERKCVPDLLSSLTHGRLYQQMLQMTRYYPEPLLLIEFGEHKPFSLQNEGDIPQTLNLSNTISKMAILSIHFCGASILWSRCSQTTTKIFADLKRNRSEPDLETAIGITNAIREGAGDREGDAEIVLDHDDEHQNDDVHTPKDILRSLPGVNYKNVDRILAQCNTLKDVCSKTKDEILEMLGGKDGVLLYDFLHSDFFNVGNV